MVFSDVLQYNFNRQSMYFSRKIQLWLLAFRKIRLNTVFNFRLLTVAIHVFGITKCWLSDENFGWIRLSAFGWLQYTDVNIVLIQNTSAICYQHKNLFVFKYLLTFTDVANVLVVLIPYIMLIWLLNSCLLWLSRLMQYNMGSIKSYTSYRIH